MIAFAESQNNNNNELRGLILDEAQRIADEDVEINKGMSENGALTSLKGIGPVILDPWDPSNENPAPACQSSALWLGRKSQLSDSTCASASFSV